MLVMQLKSLERENFFLIILQNVKFLARQSLPLRGDGKEDNSNLKQLFLFRAEDNPTIYEWLSWRNDTYISKDMQNKVLKLMALNFVNIAKSKFLHSNGRWDYM